MKVELGDVLDRLSILIHKCEKINITQSAPEFFQYARELLLECPDVQILDAVRALRELYDTNGRIWSLEADIRSGKEGILGLEEVGRRAIMIREQNKHRIEIKNGLMSYPEIKKDHASE